MEIRAEWTPGAGERGEKFPSFAMASGNEEAFLGRGVLVSDIDKDSVSCCGNSEEEEVVGAEEEGPW